MADELAKAITKSIDPVLRSEGFQRRRRREYIRHNGRTVQRLDFQVSSWGGRDFCVNISTNLIASNEFVTLQPGFRLSGRADNQELWLPSKTLEEAEASIEVVIGLIRKQAFPFFDKTKSVEGFSEQLGNERWASRHHLSFERGVAAALVGSVSEARKHLREAIRLYEVDGRDWCLKKIDQAKQLCEALESGRHAQLLSEWEKINAKAHGVY